MLVVVVVVDIKTRMCGPACRDRVRRYVEVRDVRGNVYNPGLYSGRYRTILRLLQHTVERTGCSLGQIYVLEFRPDCNPLPWLKTTAAGELSLLRRFYYKPVSLDVTIVHDSRSPVHFFGAA